MYYKWGKKFVRANIKFDNQLKTFDNLTYDQIKKDIFEQASDLRVLKEIIKVENDLKKRLTKFKLYSQHLSLY